jgi:4-diphosphocytidyl-2-C-methyl-D-erythritol kinase
VGTKEAYAGCTFSKDSKTISQIISQPFSSWKNDLRNDFENTVFKIYPELQKAKESLYMEGATYASMTGSGSTLFGIFEAEPLKTYSNDPEVLELIMKF